MKTILIISLLISSTLFSNELSWVDEQVNAIKPSRNGASNYNISRLDNPFVYLKKNITKDKKNNKKASKKRKKPIYYTKKSKNKYTNSGTKKATKNVIRTINLDSVFTLSAIINSSALINKKWYKLGDKFHSYKIVKIGKTSVTLSKRKNKNIYLLSTKSSTNKLKFK